MTLQDRCRGQTCEALPFPVESMFPYKTWLLSPLLRCYLGCHHLSSFHMTGSLLSLFENRGFSASQHDFGSALTLRTWLAHVHLVTGTVSRTLTP
ncbi:hypothetical protein DPMN_115772 [Dreissena polymorpha]|uniref:Uncharacterized protein n=1 Tax=Dreissena polymorpha TaxID=45954 RepID=A0A9D4KMG4_DREPO|nr:hypothetical protein DPMN_115772 [Dreissena polymorpha]